MVLALMVWKLSHGELMRTAQDSGTCTWCIPRPHVLLSAQSVCSQRIPFLRSPDWHFYHGPYTWSLGHGSLTRHWREVHLCTSCNPILCSQVLFDVQVSLVPLWQAFQIQETHATERSCQSPQLLFWIEVPATPSAGEGESIWTHSSACTRKYFLTKFPLSILYPFIMFLQINN